MSTAKLLRILASAWLGAVLLWAPSSFATASYPQIIADTLTMPCVPTCMLCHEDLQGGKGTIQEGSFGITMIAAGVVEQNPGAVPPALMTIETNMTDTDADGTPDITELRAGGDPSEPGQGNVCGGGPLYGCGARIAPTPEVDGIALAAALSLVFALVIAGRRGRHSIPASGARSRESRSLNGQ